MQILAEPSSLVKIRTPEVEVTVQKLRNCIAQILKRQLHDMLHNRVA